MSDPFFFGYGSLVNRATHEFSTAFPAKLRGWQRVWRHTTLRDVAFLTVEPAEGVEIDGLIAKVPGSDWEELDEREWAYDRLGANDQIHHAAPFSADVHVYSIHLCHSAPTETRHAIRLSYLDTVIQGYLREFGEEGARGFIDTTQGWDIRVLDDRKAPFYPRHQPLAANEQRFIDSALANLPVDIVPIEEA